MLHRRYLRFNNTHNVLTLSLRFLLLAQDKTKKCCVKVYRAGLSSHGFK